ncbi:antibiotic biosynthesis monooxygenase [Halomonas sp. CnH100-B]|jgi:heme-degrading monooxygenase HmoA|uniref:Antibiotic biosynthesis monooxygenase n=1 Tax=Vreelandella aquamarina TaxID=77097 RepID=A0A857GJF4_9GAMM|nr:MULTISPECIES: antibiotic biosynthesis monooxygenase family protein [Halomonas]MAO62263.1 antibiotic biosynthesis monooxygenase [Halomonas sp.]MCO7230301.1 antibiotic biosynthesis monooxygenase [Halomonas sp. CnH100-B]MDK9688956.1 antibiotic biosynthesis monooxygenase family protein [Halomonas sp. LC1]MDP4558872.1 antibiotic biosynthesis monooxygenase family protein [Halomonas meridiana]QHD49419.1 antibiotic biosynthesis monooxygenase [Halomonas meridiana]|tara:strand:- start:275 stop:562 length:288 start_codon:yes stop_codon:yes gene_type:complete
MIKIIIERRIMPGLEEEYEHAAREAMRVSLGVRGFVGGETLVELGHTDRRLMITKWRDLRAWKEWHASEERAMAMQRILPLLTEDETIRLYEPGY